MVDGKEKYKFDLGVKELIFFFVVFFFFLYLLWLFPSECFSLIPLPFINPFIYLFIYLFIHSFPLSFFLYSFLLVTLSYKLSFLFLNSLFKLFIYSLSSCSLIPVCIFSFSNVCLLHWWFTNSVENKLFSNVLIMLNLLFILIQI